MTKALDSNERTASELGPAPLRSEAMRTFLDGILSTLTLTGLALNALFGGREQTLWRRCWWRPRQPMDPD